MIASGRVSRTGATSFADGSVGQLRWYPDRYLELGVDGDGDRRSDIWRSQADALASIGHALGRGWELGQPWVYEVEDREFDPKNQFDQRRLRGNNFLLSDFRRLDGKAWTAEQMNMYARRLRPASAPGRAYAVGRNFLPLAFSSGIVPYTNEEESHAWGIAVGLLANAIAEA